jgi:hypothetical protein
MRLFLNLKRDSNKLISQKFRSYLGFSSQVQENESLKNKLDFSKKSMMIKKIAKFHFR